MKAGDQVQVKQLDSAILRFGEEPTPGVAHWLYATILEVLDDGALVEIAHPGNREQGARKKVLRADLRTVDDVLAEHDRHSAKDTAKLDLNRADHRELNNLRAALERMTPEKKEA